ncbi:uncharacterized protein TNCV_3691351 [Trichonephila clavipes]|nr:uncharacterized protein TNCV_3691351 [Trichonephila clavipes]
MRAKMGIMMGYAQRTKDYRIWLIDENKLVETINVRFDENKRGINFKQKVNSNLGYNLNLPDYYDDENDFDRVKDSLTSRLVSKTSTETPSTSENPDVSSASTIIRMLIRRSARTIWLILVTVSTPETVTSFEAFQMKGVSSVNKQRPLAACKINLSNNNSERYCTE